jgi:hypothetical protein
MDAAEMRVAIAKDVISRVQSGTMHAVTGEFVSDSDECRVCALGGLLISAAANGVDVDVEESECLGERVCDGDSGLCSVFSREQLVLIETCYEGLNGYFADEATPRAMKFHRANPGNTKRLLAIMENIVANGGTFRPTIAKAVRLA